MMKLTFKPCLSPDERRQWDAFIDESESGTPYQLAAFYDWWFDVDPTIDGHGFFWGTRDDQLCFCGLGFIRKMTETRYIYEFPHGPTIRTLPDLLEGLPLIREMIDMQYPLLVGPYLVYEPYIEHALQEIGFVRTDRRWYDATAIIDIAQSEDRILASFTKRARYAIKKAKNANYVVTVEETTEACTYFTEIHNTLALERGFSPIHQGYVRRVVQGFDEYPGRGKLFFLRDADGMVIAAALVIFTHKIAWYHKGTSVKGKPVNAQFLHWHIAQWFKNRGMSKYDLGGVDLTQPNHSVNVFKLSMVEKGQPMIMLPQFECKGSEDLWEGKQ